jgi:hypothetical protein
MWLGIQVVLRVRNSELQVAQSIKVTISILFTRFPQIDSERALAIAMPFIGYINKIILHGTP